MGPTAQGCVCWGRGLDGGCLTALTLARPCLVLSIEHRLKELRSLLQDPLEVSGDLLHLHAFCWPHAALPCPSRCCCGVSGLSLPDLGAGGGCSPSPVLVPVLLSSSGSVKVVGDRECFSACAAGSLSSWLPRSDAKEGAGQPGEPPKTGPTAPWH